jgi:hypothetical protein
MTEDVRDSVETIAAELATWEIPFVELDAFGTADPVAIAAMIDAFVREHLGSAVAGHLFCSTSIGSTHGIALADGRRVVLKARPPQSTNPDLPLDLASCREIASAQRWLHARGVPCPAPLCEPAPLGHGIATVDSFLADGHVPDGRLPAVRTTLVHAQHEHARLLEPLRPSLTVRHFLPPRDRLFPQPHSKLFDVDATAHEAGWIEAIARRARDIAEPVASAMIAAHCDWRIEHVRLDDRGDVVASYDWDSIGIRSETQIVGITMHGFTCDWSSSAGVHLPTIAEMLGWLDDWQRARGRPFTAQEHAAARAWCVYAIAYGARISIAPGDREWPTDTWPHLLQTAAEPLLRG